MFYTFRGRDSLPGTGIFCLPGNGLKSGFWRLNGKFTKFVQTLQKLFNLRNSRDFNTERIIYGGLE